MSLAELRRLDPEPELRVDIRLDKRYEPQRRLMPPYRQATSVFPSLTPVCLTSIATGAGPAVHHIPSLVWWNRQERRVVEYGSSFAALRAAGLSQSLLDPIFNMNAKHLDPEAVTIYEALEDAGLTAAAVNITCYRGRQRHLTTLPGLGRAATTSLALTTLEPATDSAIGSE